MLKSKKAKSLVPKTAKDCNVSEELAMDVVNFYYTKLRKKMEALEDPYIGVPSLGIFKISKRKLQHSINKLTAIIKSDTQESFKMIKRFKISESLRDKQIVLLDKIEADEKERRKRKQDLEES